MSFFSFSGKNFTADGYTSGSAPTINNIGEITLDGYEERTDGMVFSSSQLDKLYKKLIYAATGTDPTTYNLATAKSEISNSQSTVTGSASNGNNWTQQKALDFNTMQSTLIMPITLKFGGIDWTVVYATTNTTAGVNTKAGDLVVTLWANENLTSSQWHTTALIDTTVNFPSSMYSTSYIRVKTLNAGGDDGSAAQTGSAFYADTTNSRMGEVTLDDRKQNQFAKFTLTNNVLKTTDNTDPSNPVTQNPSLAQFLTAPKNVAYQEEENWVWSYMGPGNPNLCPNEAWGTPDTTSRHTRGDGTGGWDGGSTGMGALLGKRGYYEWANDLLWLPSITETGFFANNGDWGASLWGIPNEAGATDIIKSTKLTTTDVSWLRSGYNYSSVSDSSRGLSSAGDKASGSVTVKGGVRPALHLNLDAADDSKALELKTPAATVEKEYNGKAQVLSGEAWYKSVLDDSSICKKTYTDQNDDEVTELKDAGEYTVTYELKNTKYYWADYKTNTSLTRKVKFTIKPKKLGVVFKLNTTTGVPTLELASGAAAYAADQGDENFKCQIRYFDGETDLGTDLSKLKKAQPYTAKAEFGGTRGFNYVPDTDKTISFTNPPTRVKVSWLSQSQEVPFNGYEQYFSLILQNGTATATLYEDYGDSVVKISDTKFSAVEAGKYRVSLSLTDKTGEHVWDETGKTDDFVTYFEITPAEVTIPIAAFDPADQTVTEREKMNAVIEVPALASGTLKVTLGAYYLGTCIDDLCEIDLSTVSVQSKGFELDTSRLNAGITYDLGLRCTDPNDPNAKNYTFILDDEYQITVNEAALAGGISWRLTAGGTLVGTKTDPAETNSIVYENQIVYDGKLYSFTLNATGIGFAVDTAYNKDGFINGYKTVKKNAAVSLTAAKDAGEYVTTAFLRKGDETKELKIEWKIDKAKFDLSKVRWLDDGKVTFNERGMSVTLDPDTIPEGLTPNYSGVRTPTQVNQRGTATVGFDVADTKNYIVPVDGDKTSYLFTDEDGILADFEWEKEWEVVPAKIPVSWTVGTITVNNKKINVEKIAGGFDDYLDYTYFETDTTGKILDENNPLTEPVFVEGTVKYYVVKVAVKAGFATSYLLNPEAEEYHVSPVFEVGHALTTVQLVAKKTEYVYWGNPVAFLFKVTQGTAVESAFDIAYYRGTLRLSGAPKDVGEYRAQVSLKSGYTDKYCVDGVNAFDFKIVRATIKIDWNTGTKPPALKLTTEQKSAIAYDFIDANGNAVSLSALQNPGTYRVRASIKNASLKNYIFDNDATTTDWESFTVTPGSPIVDPDTAAPLPSIDPNDPTNPENPEQQKIKVQLVLTSGSAVYNGTNQTAQFVNTAGLPKEAFNVIYKQNGQIVSAPNSAGAYEIEVSLTDAYALAYELTGATKFVYTIIDSNGDGSITGSPDGASGGNASDATFGSYLPVILSGIALALIVVFGVMSLNYSAAIKAAKEKTRKLSQVAYSISPLPLLAIVLGMSESNWWIVAGVLMGVALVMGIVAFTFHGKKRKALALLEEEEARIAEEKEYADKEQAREEQVRRDNELRMMFAAMQQNTQQPQFQMDDIRGMLAETVSAILPGIQQAMLPPASPDAASAAAASSAAQEEIDKLHEQIAEQQARMEQQQELLTQILQNQQSYAAYEEPADDISWLGQNDEMISLEESYGNLSDEEKRCYYEIGSYIMNKPRTSQNDGRYAVLFKYRRKTLFKLCIIGDAPVLYYPSESGGREEIRILGTNLELAKSLIDRCMLKVDNELG